jgi:DNA modification methylase
MKTNSHIYIFTSWKVIEKIKPIIEKHFEVKNCLIWNKNNWSMGDLKNNYAEKYEMIIFATKGNKNLQSELRPVNVIDCPRTNNPEHPTQKPVNLLRELIKNSTKPKELILDYFAGSGSTLIASKEENRKWIGIELKRLENAE